MLPNGGDTSNFTASSIVWPNAKGARPNMDQAKDVIATRRTMVLIFRSPLCARYVSSRRAPHSEPAMHLFESFLCARDLSNRQLHIQGLQYIANMVGNREVRRTAEEQAGGATGGAVDN